MDALSLYALQPTAPKLDLIKGMNKLVLRLDWRVVEIRELMLFALWLKTGN